ncbi:hypothetical protein ARMGADRAFT_573768 [Armillaria gallica]|uniref:Uncharacterized protein n=1 Tax=Armillaria gallica TaxID=47427 RepID=A0A2H3DSW1_ARMGA|nr:hypothetical protein ARMGADRAFT_573768 [Armillaria gallica]
MLSLTGRGIKTKTRPPHNISLPTKALRTPMTILRPSSPHPTPLSTHSPAEFCPSLPPRPSSAQIYHADTSSIRTKSEN